MEKRENIVYRTGSDNKKHRLDLFMPGGKGPFPVLLFIHGGSWYNGCKEMYEKLGHHLTSREIVTVIINYRLGHETNFEGMAEDCSGAVKWIFENIDQYTGDMGQIFLAGHSAGGHLSALITLNPEFFKNAGVTGSVKGCILIDAFGLNMDYVMHNNQAFFVKELERVFTKDPEKWREAAPVRFAHLAKMPFLILTGSRTYPYLTMDNEIFRMNLEEYKVPNIYKVIPNRNHVEMITSLQNTQDLVYEDILDFINFRAGAYPKTGT